MVFYVWFLFLLWLSPHLVHAETRSAPGVMLSPAQVVAAGPFTLSPPSLRYDASGTLHVAWLEKPDQQGIVKMRQIAGASRQLGSAVQVNPATLGPEALHQAPGLATAENGTVALSWSTPNRTPGAMFASDLRVAASGDGGQTFTVPVQVNDDRLPISHTFEDLLRGPEHDLYVMWLDGRGKDRSGAAVQFACSRDGGATFGPNMTVDGMACPCCRPMLAASPDGPVKGERLADSQDIPLQFLEHILLDLKHSGIVRARRGAKGGYWLARPAEDVSIADVIRAVEGPIANVQSAPPESITYTGSAKELQNVWIAVRASLREVLESTSLADLVSGELPSHVKELADDKDAWQPR